MVAEPTVPALSGIAAPDAAEDTETVAAPATEAKAAPPKATVTLPSPDTANTTVPEAKDAPVPTVSTLLTGVSVSPDGNVNVVSDEKEFGMVKVVSDEKTPPVEVTADTDAPVKATVMALF